MERAYKRAVNSDLYTRVSWLATSESERQGSLNALRDGQMIADGIVWAWKAIKGLGSVRTPQTAVQNVNRGTLTQ